MKGSIRRLRDSAQLETSRRKLNQPLRVYTFECTMLLSSESPQREMLYIDPIRNAQGGHKIINKLPVARSFAAVWLRVADARRECFEKGLDDDAEIS